MLSYKKKISVFLACSAAVVLTSPVKQHMATLAQTQAGCDDYNSKFETAYSNYKTALAS